MVIFVLLLKYTLALSNLSEKNTPIPLPYPFNQDDSNWDVPWYKGIPWYIITDSDESIGLRWIFYSGILVSLKSVFTLWAYVLTVLMIFVYCAYFNLTIFSSDVCISDYESILKISDIRYKEDERKYIIEIIGYERSIDEFKQKLKKMEDIIQKVIEDHINIAISIYYT